MSRPRRYVKVPVPRFRELVLTGMVAGAVAGLPVLRTWGLQWGATEAELDAALPGDDIVQPVDHVATRAVSIEAPASTVWPWLVQLGQGRGGFYSFDWLENIAGLGIHSADEINPQWQGLAVGDPVHLAEEMALEVAVLEPDRAIVLRSPDSGGAPVPGSPPFEFSWAFVLRPGTRGTTRLVIRERYGYRGQGARPVVEIASMMSSVMTRAMLRGIKERAES